MKKSKSFVTQNFLFGGMDLSKIEALKMCQHIKQEERQILSISIFVFIVLFLNSVLHLDVLKTSSCNQKLIQVQVNKTVRDMAG